MKQIKHLAALDGIRGVAVLMVMVFHGWQAGMLGSNSIAKVAIAGQTGVDLFFVLSGFLITRILIATRQSEGYFRTFYIRRILRIFPLYYAFLVFEYFLRPWLMGENGVPVGQSWWYWMYLQNVPDTFHGLQASGPNHFWSLAVEEHFYLLWPVLIYSTPTRLLKWLCLFVFAVAFGFRAWFLYGLNVGVFYFTLCRIDGLALGALLAVFEAEQKLERMKAAFPMILCFSGIAMSLIWLRVSGEGTRWVQLFKFSVIAAFYAALIGWCAVSQQKVFQAGLNIAPLRLTGRISYSLYVLHPFCYSLVFLKIFPSSRSVAVLIVGMLSTFCAASLSYRFFEQPFLRLKRHLSYN